MTSLFSAIATALLYASLDGGLLAGIVYLLCLPLRTRLPLACVWLWRLVFVKFALGLAGIGIALGPIRSASVANSNDPLLLLLIAGLTIGLLLGLERLWREIRFLARLRRDALPPSPVWQEACNRLCQRQGIAHPPRLLLSDAIEIPMATGILSPCIVLPENLVVDSADCERILAHELAHIRHSDLWFGWLVALLEPIFCFHPLFWLARREMRLLQELAADRTALRYRPSSPTEYARLLLNLSRRKPIVGAVSLGMGESFQMLRQRLDALTRKRRPVDAVWLACAASIALGISVLSLAQRVPKSVPRSGIMSPAAITVAAPVASR